MTKYAELPTGELLQFPDDVSEREMHRTVRRKLGLDMKDLLEAHDKICDHLEGFVKASADLRSQQKETIDQMVDAATANSNRISGEIGDGIRELVKATSGLSETVRKYMGGIPDLVIQMKLTVDSLNRTLDNALGQSLATIDQGAEAHRGTAQSLERGINAMSGLAHQLADTVDAMSRLKKTKRTARRNRDGSYTFESS